MNSRPRVLIVDDDPNLLKTMGDILGVKEFEPLLAATGAEGLALVSDNEVDVLVLDLRLNDMSGMEVLQGIREIQPTVECIVLTGYASQTTAIEAVNRGVYAYLQKPIDMEQFLLLLRRAVEHKQQAEALRESEELHRVTLESISDAIFLTDDAGNFTYICPNMNVIFGYTQTEVAALGDIRKLLGPALVYDPAELAERGELSNIEREVTTKDGETRTVLITVKRVSIGAGTLLYDCHDITERKAAEEQIHFQSSLLNAVASAVIATDLAGEVLYWNRAAETLYGWAAEEAVGQKIFDLTVAPESENHGAEIMERLQQGESWAGEFLVRRKDGSTFPIFVIDSPIYDADGTLVGIIGISNDITDRKTAEAQIRYQASLLENVFDAIISTDDRSVIRTWNRGAETMCGWSAEEAIGRYFLDVIPTTFPDDNEAEIVESFHRQGFWRGELLYTRKDGSTVPVLCTASTIKDARDKIETIILVARDITDRREAERALERQLQELVVLHQVALACTEITDPDELIAGITSILADALYPQHLGVLLLDKENGHIHAHPSYRGVDPALLARHQDVPPNEGLVSLVAGSGQPVRVDDVSLFLQYVEVTPDTRSELCVPMVVDANVIGVINAESDQLGFFSEADERLLLTVAGQLATALERLRLYAETGQRAEQIGQIIRSVPDGMLLLNEEGRILQANPAGQTYVNILGDINGQPTALAQLGQGGLAQGAVLKRLGDQPLPWLLTSPPQGQWHEIHQNRRIFEAIAHPLTSDSISNEWVLLLREVTRQREVQEQLQRQERLAAVGQLASGIAHDFNNLMGAILLHSQLLDRSPNLGEKERERMGLIQAQARHASAMIEQILDFSRRSVLERHPLDLLPLLKEQVRLLQRTLPEHIEIAFEIAQDEDEYVVQADPTRIQQMVMNLAINSRDAMPQGGRLVLGLDKLQFKRPSQLPLPGMTTGEWVQLIVRDTGAGIASDVLDHLFEPFFTTKEPGKGTGLGLAQVYGIVGQHNGHISVDSQLGNGAAFTIYLPALQTAEEARAAAVEESMPLGEGRLLLLVEDNESLRTALADYLTLSGYRLLTANNGREALDVLAETAERPELILSDVVMPQMGGVALVEYLRKQGDLTPFILLTGHPLDMTVMEPLRSQGLATWLQKPINLTDLANAIAQSLA